MSPVIKHLFLLIFPALLAPTDFYFPTPHKKSTVSASESHSAIYSEQHAAPLAVNEKYARAEVEIKSNPSTTCAVFIPDLKIHKAAYYYYEDRRATTSLNPVLSYLSRLSHSPPLHS